MSCDCKRCLQADKEIERLELSLKRVQAIAKSTLAAALTRWKVGYEAGVKNANRDWESAVAYGKAQEKLRFDENATFTAEIMALEEKVLRMAPGIKAAVLQCYQIASSHKFGPDAAKTIREKFGLEI
jgi:hypothetical protein